MRNRLFLGLAMAMGLYGCVDLPELRAGCGDRAIDIDAGEDCDNYGIDGGAFCIAAGIHACRWSCATSNTCPTGFGCGRDGICRKPGTAPTWEPAETLREASTSVSAGDFNADRRADLLLTTVGEGLASTAPRLLVASATGFEPGQSLPPSNVAPRFGDATGDGISDILAPSVPGLALFKGQPTGRLSPSVFSIELKALRVVPIALRQGSATKVVVALVELDGGGVALQKIDDSGLVDARLWQWPNRDWPVFATARLDRQPDALETLVLAFPQDRALWVFNEGQAPLRASHGLASVERVRAADLNADGLVDLWVEGDGGRVAMLGDGRGGVREGQQLDVKVVDPLFDNVGQVLELFNTANGRVAAFSTAGLAILDPAADGGLGLSGEPVTGNFLDRWRLAHHLDFNGDGTLDFVAVGSGPDIKVFRQVDSQFGQATLRTAGPVQALTDGDIDGDGLTDLVWVESVDDAGVVMAAFGQLGALPTNAIELGREREWVGLITAPGEAGGPAVSVAGVIAGNRPRLAVWPGDGNRQPVTSLPFSARVDAGITYPASAVALRHQTRLPLIAFTALEINKPLGAPRASLGSQLWLGDTALQRTVGPLPLNRQASFVTPEVGLSVISIAADINADGSDELAFLTSVDAGPDQPEHAALGLATVVSDSQMQTAFFDLKTLPRPSPTSQLVWLPESSRMVVLHRQGGKSTLFLCAIQSTNLEGMTCTLPMAGQEVRSIASYRASTGTEVIALVGDTLYLMSEQPQRLDGIGAATAVSAADVDGDGLDDLIISRRLTTEVRRGRVWQQERRP